MVLLTKDIWIRRTFSLKEFTGRLHLRIHHDEDADVYINGKKVASISGYSVSYENHPLSAEHRRALRNGENVIAVHCRQTGGGQYIDVGLVSITERPREKK